MSHRGAALGCPGCRQPLEWRQQAERHLARCTSCGGVWMETGELLSLLREAQPDKAPDELMVHNDGSPRRACPVCAAQMDLAWLDFLCVDQCLEHGIFLDGGELEKALRWEVSRDVAGTRPPQLPREQAAVLAVLHVIR